MPRPVCVPCEREMQAIRSGSVEFHALVTNGPYEQWQGDLFRCGGCGASVIARFGGGPSWRHHDGDVKRDKEPIAISREYPMIARGTRG